MEAGRIPNRLRSYRTMQGYSQKKVSRLLNISDPSIVSKWERGLAFPGMMHLLRLSRIYHATPLELYDDLWQMIEHDPHLLTHDESINSIE